MRSGTHTLTWNSPMPAGQQRAHFSTKTGDSWTAIRITAHRAIGPDHMRLMDVNFQSVRRRVKHRGVRMPVSIHYAEPGRNGYDRYVDANGHIRKMTAKQKRTPADSWGYEGVLTWRRANGDRPLTYFEAITYAARLGVVIVAELKSVAFRVKATAEWMVAKAKAVGHPAWFMALINMADCRGKCEAIESAGGQFLVIFGKRPWLARRAPADFTHWDPKPTHYPSRWRTA